MESRKLGENLRSDSHGIVSLWDSNYSHACKLLINPSSSIVMLVNYLLFL